MPHAFLTEVSHANAPRRARRTDGLLGRSADVRGRREALVRADLRPRRRRRPNVWVRELGAVSRGHGPDGRILSPQPRLSQRGGRAPPPKRAATTQAQMKSTWA